MAVTDISVCLFVLVHISSCSCSSMPHAAYCSVSSRCLCAHMNERAFNRWPFAPSPLEESVLLPEAVITQHICRSDSRDRPLVFVCSLLLLLCPRTTTTSNHLQRPPAAAAACYQSPVSPLQAGSALWPPLYERAALGRARRDQT